jgi:hypothetical protein
VANNEQTVTREAAGQADLQVHFEQAMGKAGTIIKERLMEIILEYDEKIRDCWQPTKKLRTR